MKTIFRFLSCLALLAAVNLPASEPLAAAGVVGDATASTTLTNGLRFDFRGAPLDRVLNYFSSAAGYVIYLHNGVTVSGTVDAIAAQPLTADEAVHLLTLVLADRGYSVISEGKTLNIYRNSDAVTQTPIKIGGDPGKIPNNGEIVTQIMPVRSLNPQELSRALTSLLPSGTIITVNESANTLLITASQNVVHHAAELVTTLDSVSASVNSLNVYPLKYADAKSVADLVKQLFAAPDTSRAGGGTMLNLGGFGGGFGGGPGGGAPGGFGGNFGRGATAGNSSASGTTPQARIVAVADEHANSLVVSAPDALLPGIVKLLAAVDVPVDETTEIHVFRLANADSTEMAGVLQSLFPDTSSSTDAGGTQFAFPGQGGLGGLTVSAQQATSGQYAKKLGQVLAVPDPRTSCLLVTAAKSVMPEIIYIVEGLDAVSAGHLQVRVVRINNANIFGVQQSIQDLYSSGTTTTSSSSTQNDLLEQRRTSMMQNMFNSSASTGSSSSTSGGAGRTSGGTTGTGN